MLMPGVGSGTLKPTAPVTRVVAGTALAESLRAAPACRFTANGSRLPPISRKSALPPIDVKLSAAPSGFQVVAPAATVRGPSPSAARPPHALPLPESALGR